MSLFINDLPNSIANLFADDTLIYSQSSSLGEVLSQLQNDIDNLTSWFFIFINANDVHDVDIMINNNTLTVDDTVKYLYAYKSQIIFLGVSKYPMYVRS